MEQGASLFQLLGTGFPVVWLVFWLLVWWQGRFLFAKLQAVVVGALWLVSDKLLEPLNHRYPKWVQWLNARLNRHHLTGLPLTLFSLTLLALSALLAGLVEDVVMSESIVSVDQWIATTMNDARTTTVVQGFHVITQLGNPIVVGALLLILVIAAPWLHWSRVIAVLLVLVGSIGTSVLGKYAFHRPRPLEALLIEPSYSFPSSHATLAVAFYGFLFYLYWQSRHTWNQQWLVMIACSVVLLLGLSRLILGVHFFSDIMAGYLLGLIWLLLGVSLLKWYDLNYSPLHKRLPR
jgi:undecaprenyl-diphosphatase